MPHSPDGDGALAARCALEIHAAFAQFQESFLAVTRRARGRFERREWRGMQSDGKQRLDSYAMAVTKLRDRTRSQLGPRLADTRLWRAIKAAFSELVEADRNVELARTFFNSLTRRLFSTVGVNPEIEFVSHAPPWDDGDYDVETFAGEALRPDSAALLRRILERFAFRAPYEDLERDVQLGAALIDRQLRGGSGAAEIERVEILRPVFFRNKAAYLIGRMLRGQRPIPFVLPLLHEPGGVRLDAVLMDEDDVSIVFSFTRSYFHVESDCPRSLVTFLKSIMPLKPIAELYSSLGRNKHGKTELYRSLRNHLARTADRFATAEGDEGMVMLVFTLPSYDVVFKVIRDTFAYPKSTTRRDVMDRYRLVFNHDRVGRLVDAQEFEHLQFDRDRFSDELLQSLLQHAGETVRIEGDAVVIRHLYAERRLTPLNVYLRRADPAAAAAAIIDYGQSIKDLAAADIFPGDFLLKNFGVTRHGRVVFYDYDELGLVSEYRFRELPPPRTVEDELEPEPWFAVGERDVFPEEFARFLGLTAELRETFLGHHGDVLAPAFWRGLQERHRRGELVDVFPYPPARRLPRDEDRPRLAPGRPVQ